MIVVASYARLFFLLSCVVLLSLLPSPVLSQWNTGYAIMYTHYDNTGCYDDGSQYSHNWMNGTCQYDHLSYDGPWIPITPTISSDLSGITLCVNNASCSSRPTRCAYYYNNLCQWDLSGTTFKIQIINSTSPATIAPTPPPTRPPPSTTISYTHYGNAQCTYDAWTFTHTWYDGVCVVDHLSAQDYIEMDITPKMKSPSVVELCTSNHTNPWSYTCGNATTSTCSVYGVNSCIYQGPGNYFKLNINSGTTNPPTTMGPPTTRPTNPPTVIPGQTIIMTSFRDSGCGLLQTTNWWYNGTCVMGTFDQIYRNIKPRIISSSSLELCLHDDTTSHCDAYFYDCRLFASDICIRGSSGNSFRFQLLGVPTTTPTPPPRPTISPNPGSVYYQYTHYDGMFGCTQTSVGYPHIWYNNQIQYELLGGQIFLFNATYEPFSNRIYLCLEDPSYRSCQYVYPGACTTGPLNSGPFMLRVIPGGSTLPPTPTPPTPIPTRVPTPIPTAYPPGSVNISYIRYSDGQCQSPIDSDPVLLRNEMCDLKYMNNAFRQTKASMLSPTTVRVCLSSSSCVETSMSCAINTINDCIFDFSTGESYRYSIVMNPTSTPSSERSSSPSSTMTIVGIVIAIVAVILCLVGGCVYYRKRQAALRQQSLHMQQDGGYTRV